MLTYHSSAIARQSILLFILVLPISAFAGLSCKHSISYGLTPGAYTDILGKVDPDLTEIAERIINDRPEYCNMEIRIEFISTLSSRQMVHKKTKANRHYFKVIYKAPEYRVTIRNSDGQVIHQMTFTNEWASTTFPQDSLLGSKEILYQSWNDQREKIYTQLEEEYNEYNDFNDFLNSLLTVESQWGAGRNLNAKNAQDLNFQLMMITDEVPFPEMIDTTAPYTRASPKPINIPLRPKDPFYER